MITMMIGNEDRHGDGEYDGERDHIEKHCGVGGWCLEWFHPPPKGVQRKGRERERERNGYSCFIHSP